MGEEEDDDGGKGDGRNHEAEGQRCQNAAIVQPGEEHDRQHDEGALVYAFMACHPCDCVDQKADGNGIGCFQHGVGEDEIKADIEGHQRPDDMFRLGILPARGSDGGCHLTVDHGDAGIEQTGEPAGDERGIGTALADSKVPAHIFANENDPDAKRPDMRRPENAQQAVAGRCGCCISHDQPPVRCCSVRASISPSREDVSISSE